METPTHQAKHVDGREDPRSSVSRADGTFKPSSTRPPESPDPDTPLPKIPDLMNGEIIAGASAAALSTVPAAADVLKVPPPTPPEIPAMPPPVTAPPSLPVEPSAPPPDPIAVALEADERFVSLRRSYGERLVSMAAIFRDLPRRLTEDGPLSALRMCDAPADELRERAFEIFSEALGSHQEQQVGALQLQLSQKENEVARMGRQLTTLIAEQRGLSDVNGVKLRAAEAELSSARSRLEELEEFYRKASTRQSALLERAETLEEETRYWRSRGAPLRERCEQLEAENVELRREREDVNEAKAVAARAEAEATAAKVAMEGAHRIAMEAREQAQKATADSEGRWLHQGLSVVLSRVFEVIPMDEGVQQKLYSAATGEEFMRAGTAFVEALERRWRGVEEALATSESSLKAATDSLQAGEEELIKARTTASMSAQHAHEMVDRTIAAEHERHEMDLLKATKEEREAREAAEVENAFLRAEKQKAADELHAALAKAKVQFDSALDERSQQWAKDMRILTASYRDARAELAEQAEQLKEARRLKAEAERALQAGLDQAMQRSEALEATLRERSYLSAQLAGHASSALQQELLSIFGARDLLATAASRSAHNAAAAGSILSPTQPVREGAYDGALASTFSGFSLASTGLQTREQRHGSVQAEAAEALSAATTPSNAELAGRFERSSGTHGRVGEGAAALGSISIAGGVPAARRPPVALPAALAASGLQVAPSTPPPSAPMETHGAW